MESNKKKQIVIVGGGPVGALHACYMSKRGFQVDIYESRKDIRKIDNAAGRSINLALSCRGIESLQKAGLSQKAIDLGIPMHARMIHLLNGKVYPVPYGKTGQYLLSVDRMKLNRFLLSAAASQPNVNLHFEHKLISCNVGQPSAVFKRQDGRDITITCDLLVGCDGSYSAVRRQMQRGRFDYSQEYIPHGYKELTIPPTSDGNYAMAIEYLHIWPRHEFMLIALPNLDKSFTCTLFMPFSKFDQLADGEKVLQFFNQVFPDVVPLIGEKQLKEDFFSLPPLSLVSVKCSPYHHGNTVALLGDAAHAVVPFFGQGLNASLEDVLVFDELMEKLNEDVEYVLPEYTKVRVKDGHAIADLSKQNYIEVGKVQITDTIFQMRSSVVSPWFLFRKKVDDFINFLFPSIFIPKYTMVAFTRTPYHQVIERAERQGKIVDRFLGAGVVATLAVSFLLYKRYQAGELKFSTFKDLLGDQIPTKFLFWPSS